MEAKVRASLDLGDATPASASKALKGSEEELVAIIETQAKVGEARVSVVESPMWVTRSTMKAKVAIAKLKCAAAPMTDVGESREAKPSIAKEDVPTPSEIRLLEVDRCPKFLEDSVPLEVKKEALKRLVGEDL